MTLKDYYKNVIAKNKELAELLPEDMLEQMMGKVEVHTLSVNSSATKEPLTVEGLHGILTPNPFSRSWFILKSINEIDYKDVWKEAQSQLGYKLSETPEVNVFPTADGGTYATVISQHNNLLHVLEIKLRPNALNNRYSFLFRVIEDDETSIELFRKEIDYKFPVGVDTTGLTIRGLAITN